MSEESDLSHQRRRWTVGQHKARGGSFRVPISQQGVFEEGGGGGGGARGQQRKKGAIRRSKGSSREATCRPFVTSSTTSACPHKQQVSPLW